MKQNIHLPRVIAVDFDGTLCENKWPDIGAPNWEIINYLKKEKEKGARIILWTCRQGNLLRKAEFWCNDMGLYFDALNDNIPEGVIKYGTNPRKVAADEYIDDHAVTKFELPYYKVKPVTYKQEDMFDAIDNDLLSKQGDIDELS